MSFKILAIEILDKCNSEHFRNLEKEYPYVFYKNYEFKRKGADHVIKLLSEDFDLYSKDNNIKINISAIVGQNGSGKSTLVDIFIKGINNFFYAFKKSSPYKEYHITNKVEGLFLNIFYKIDHNVYRLHIYEEFVVSKYIIKFKIIKAKFIDKSKSYIFLESCNEKNIENLFYSEIINYSHYAYNSKIEGDWISKIFHKNDSYQTPIVINPWRKEGNIDINVENGLIYQRLLANLFRFDSNKNLNLNLGNNLEASLLVIKLSDSNYYINKLIEDFDIFPTKYTDSDLDEIFNILLARFNENKTEIKVNIRTLKLTKLYLFYKLISICAKYEEYSKGAFFDFKEKEFIDLERLISTIYEDNSHITFKIRQTINYLVNDHIKFNPTTSNRYTVNSLAENINLVKGDKNIINFLPPPIFRTELILKSKKRNENISFHSLSSGEKQLIYTTNSIYYHLTNIDSVHKSHVNNKIKYNYVNIIFEEIELYFHPEFQKTFINNFLKGLYKLNLRFIKGINVIFVTHSPFILSDIPNSNILYLNINNEGKSISLKEKKKSFASNIHHLLGDNFFFENNIYIGEFARNKIDDIIRYIKIGNEKDIEYYYQLIEKVDEPILNNKLLEMLFEKFPDFQELKKINQSEMMVEAFAKKMGVKIEIKKN